MASSPLIIDTPTTRAPRARAPVDASSVKRMFALSMIAVPLMVLGAMLALGVSVPETVLCVSGVISLLFCLAPVVLSPGRFDVFHPCMFIALSVGVATTWKSFYLCFGKSPAIADLLDGDRAEAMLPGAALILVGVLCLCVGYFLASHGIRLRSRMLEYFSSLNLHDRRLRVLSVFVLVLAAAGTADMLRKTGGLSVGSLHDLSKKRRAEVQSNDSGKRFASLGYNALVGHTLPSVVFLTLLARQVSQGFPRRGRMWLVVVAAGACAYPVLTSSRSSLLLLAINAMVLLNLARMLTLRGVLIAAVLGGTGFVAMKQIRSSGAERASAEEGFVDSLLGRRNLCCVVKTTGIYEAAGDRFDYFYGSTFGRWVVAPVPRTAWPAKPPVTIGSELTEMVLGRENPVGGGMPPGLIGELILNFGAIGVPIGCLVYGVLLAVYYYTLRPYAQASAVGAMIYVLTLTPVTHLVFSSEFSRAVIEMLTSLVCLAPILFFATTRPTGPPPPTEATPAPA
ncbi:MAG: oligosaccharide repeat unit polymerase [Planctomycetota bacterium]